MTPPSAHVARDQDAAALGRVARVLDGSVSRAIDQAGRERFLVALGGRRNVRSRWVLLAAAAGVMAVLLAVFAFEHSAANLDYRVTGPLTKEGQWLRVAPDRGAATLKFSEGTEIELGPGSDGRVDSVSSAGARIVLGDGRLHARVVHRPRAFWSVTAGPYVIEVTGTAFDVTWSTARERLELSLHDGGVIVRGPSLRDGLRLSAGQRVVAHALTGSVELSSLFSAAAPVEPKPRAETPALPKSSNAPAAPPAPRAPTWSELVAAGNFRAVLDAAKVRGIDQILARGSLSDLVALSDAARYGGDRALSRRGLLSQRSRFGSSAEARAAAFVLGRMADDGGASSEALKWYDRYLVEAPNGSFAAEALGRKLVVLVRGGDRTAVRTTAEAYLKRFPNGAHSNYAREVLHGL